MDARKVVVMVEDMEVARTALRWALQNLLRYGDLITLLHVFHHPSSSRSSRNRKKLRLLRLQGYQLALSFKEICNSFPNSKTEIVVTECDQEGAKIADLINQIGASTLVLGLHDQSFLYRLNCTENKLKCKVLAIKQPTTLTATRTISLSDSSTNMDFSQIEIADGLSFREVSPPKIPYRICPDPSAIFWRSGTTKRKETC
ncbi:hypothetical protein DCAR_0312827 [Daucus carota subsp. sativus]|uniref:UspA domain-containing protein n=1 Tax=Daucus carota subsp. sativus TaxID=79200 RepID=A0AAF1AV08_DAUCS|nr:PREDICTED: uncharacterized protein LOC108211946 [Daucus carota subsp. sativus]WOG93541.1 hypothetical protein DCAR_0312827 [Daucus carota subsp. sativus]